MNGNRITMNGSGSKKIIDRKVNLAQGKVIETPEARKLREKMCYMEIGKVL